MHLGQFRTRIYIFIIFIGKQQCEKAIEYVLGSVKNGTILLTSPSQTKLLLKETAMIRVITQNSSIQCSAFKSDNGAQEFYIMISTGNAGSLIDALTELDKSYSQVLEHCGLSDETLVAARFHVNNLANQKEKLQQSPIYRAVERCAVSIIEQPPLDGRFVTLFVYHIECRGKALIKRTVAIDDQKWRNGCTVKGEHYTMFWLMNIDGRRLPGPQHQTREVFNILTEFLEQEGMTLRGNTIRTWVYIHDIDRNYSGMVDARREFFIRHGLTKETRYIASTGIEGRSKETNTIVTLDSLSLTGLRPGQLITMEAPTHLSPTIQYGVTFERGTRVRFGDRSHLYISGTASINCNGDVVHTGDVRKQTSRTLENISALLHQQSATLADMAYLVVYLRNPEDYLLVKEVAEREVPVQVPRIYLEAAVCRPDWLVEIEGVAIIPDSADFPVFL